MTPCPACAEHLETIRALGETCDRLVREREEARADGFAAGVEAAAKACDRIAGNTLDFGRDRRRGAGQCSAAVRALTAMQRGRSGHMGCQPEAHGAVFTSSGGGARLHPPAEAGE